MQLVAYGAQDIYLTGNPQITFFKVVYRRHTNFSMEAIQQTLSGQTSLGGRSVCTISRNGDLVHKMYVHCDTLTMPSGDDDCNAGTALLKEVELEIGGQRIDRHYAAWLETWAELTEPNPAGKVAVLSAAGVFGMTGSTLYQKMTGSCGAKTGGSADPGTIGLNAVTIPLQFWFCRNPGLALPLIALQYHEVKVNLTLGTATEIGTGAAISGLQLWADYIYLDTDERRRFAQVSHEYLIEQVQRNITSNRSGSIELTFNHPVKELIWIGTPDTHGISTPMAWNPSGGVEMKLSLNGHDRFEKRDALYFTRPQVWQHHTGFGGLIVRDSIGVYSFALKPEEHQPSGTCNFSRIDNARLEVSGGTLKSSLTVFAVNYNVLRIMSGMGGLAYSN